MPPDPPPATGVNPEQTIHDALVRLARRLLCGLSVAILSMVLLIFGLSAWGMTIATSASPDTCNDQRLGVYVIGAFAILTYGFFKRFVVRYILCFNPEGFNPARPLRIWIHDLVYVIAVIFWPLLGIVFLVQTSCSSADSSLYEISLNITILALISLLVAVAGPPIIFVAVVGLGHRWSLRAKKEAQIRAARILASLPIVGRGIFARSDECAVCLASFAEDDVQVKKTHCSHFFHEDCLKGWTDMGKLSCPVCRAPLDGGQIIGNPQQAV